MGRCVTVQQAGLRIVITLTFLPPVARFYSLCGIVADGLDGRTKKSKTAKTILLGSMWVFLYIFYLLLLSFPRRKLYRRLGVGFLHSTRTGLNRSENFSKAI